MEFEARKPAPSRDRWSALFGWFVFLLAAAICVALACHQPRENPFLRPSAPGAGPAANPKAHAAAAPVVLTFDQNFSAEL